MNNEWRRKRLAAASQKAGGDAALGRLMGHKRGAQVGHMLSGRRPITEKTIECIENLPGFAGWFDAEAQSAGGGDMDALYIPLLENAASMGAGCDELSCDVFAGKLPVAVSWATQHVRPASFGALRFIHGVGDSMEPTFKDGDILLVDTTQRDPGIAGGIYVMRADGQLFIKRVRLNIDKRLEISSDNPGFKTVDVLTGSHEVEFIGRVIWVWNGKKV